MRKRVDELLNERPVLDPPALLSSVEEINLELTAGVQYQDSLKIGTADGQDIRGQVYSDNNRIVFAEDSFLGSSCSVLYGIDTYGLEADSEISGNIIFITNIGELHIPVYAIIGEDIPKEHESVRDLEGFARLAAGNFREAFLMYTNEDFKRILRGKNSKFQSLYKGLSENPVTYQHLEEFLIAAGKKEKISLSLDKQERASYVLNHSVKDTLYIYKSTWGYTRIEITVQGDFIETEKKVITSDDFIGRVYGLEFILDREKLQGRYCCGKIILKTVYEELELEIEAVPDGDMELVPSRYRQERQLKLMKSFLALQMRKLDYRTWYDNSKQWIDEIKAENEDTFTLFTEAYLAFCQEDTAKVVSLLWPIKTGEIELTKTWEKAVYLYLSKEAGLLPEEKSDIAPQLYAYYQKEPQNYLLIALYIQELEGHGYTSPWGLAELEKAHNAGCRSPFLYLRAWKILDKQEALLRKLTPFIIRVLCFAEKEGILSESLLLRAAFLTANVKSFHPSLYRLLASGYEKYQKKELLEAICRHIMNDTPNDPAYYKWYEKAVEQDIRLTRLYEYYIETRPEDNMEPLPVPVKLYFSYTPAIGDRKKAYLFACIIKDKENDPISYENYKKAAYEFALMSIKRARINEFYAVLYNEFFEDCRDAETAGYLSGVMFSHKLTCKNPNMRNVIVCHRAFRDMQTFPITEGTAYPKIYSKDVCILFEDEKKRRFAATVDYDIEQLMNYDRISKSCMLFGVWDTGMQLYCCHERTWQVEINRHNLMSFWKAAENLYLTREYRDKTRKKLLDYFSKNSDDWNLLPYMESLKELTYGHIDKEATFRLLIRFGQFEKAFNLINRLGYEKIETVLLMKLAIAWIQKYKEELNEELLGLACYVYRNGRFNDDILDYISRYAILDIQSSEELWRHMSAFGMDTYAQEEKYLLLSMFVIKTSPGSECILENYACKSGNPSVRRAYINYLSMLYLLKEREPQDYTADRMKSICKRNVQTSTICDLAWTKYKAAEQSFSAEDEVILGRIIEYCEQKELKFGFFKALPEEVVSGVQLEDKVFAEESLPTGCRVVIHYKIDSEYSRKDDWKSEPLKESIAGLYVREFMLFYGESLSYYCTVYVNDKTYDTKTKSLSVGETRTKGNTRYQLLNRILMQRALKAVGSSEDTMRQYLKRAALADGLFEIRQ